MQRVVRSSLLALLALPALLLAALGWLRQWVADDAFIDFRVIQHLLAGYGPVFNAGERVEAYTSPLWVALLAVAALPWRLWGDAPPLEWLAALLGLLCSVAGLLVATLAAGGRHEPPAGAGAGGERALPALPLGALVIAALPVYWDFATSGLETGLTLLWIGVSYWGVVRRGAASRTDLIAAVIAGLGPLVRPDLTIAAAVWLALLIARRPWDWWRVARTLVVAGALPVVYQVFRMGYFAAVVPNTALAKEAGLARWDQGWRYLADFAGAYWLWVPLAPLGLWWVAQVGQRLHDREWWRSVVSLAPVVAGALHGLYIVRVGGDFMHGRMLLPSLFTVLLPAMVVRGRRWWQVVLPAYVVLPWAVASILWLHPPYHGSGNGIGPQGIADERRFYVQLAGRDRPITLADYAQSPWKHDGDAARATTARALLLDREPLPEDAVFPDRRVPLAGWVPARVAAERKSVGMFGYAAGPEVRVVDRLGLANPVGARLRLEARGRPGHEKTLPEAWTLADYSGAGSVGGDVAGVRAASAALHCGDVAVLLDAVRAPLTASRFVDNAALAWRLSALRVPADPAQAQRELCG